MANNGYNRNYNKNYRSSNYNRPSQNRNYNRNNRRRRNRKRLRNRILIVSSMIIIVVLIILLLSVMFKSCFGGRDNGKDSETINTETVAATTAAPSASESKASSSGTSNNISDITSTTEFLTPEPEDNNESATLDGNILIWNNAGYELFYGSEDSATSYSQAINGYAESLGPSVTVYSMVVPNHTEMGLPERLKNGEGYTTTSQAENIKTIYSKLGSNVTPINCYNNLSKHCNEYIYFNTDHHWTGLGSYYAYEAFAKTTNQEVLPLTECTEGKIEGFTGSFTNMVSEDLGTDTVSYWKFPYETTMEMATETESEMNTYDSVYYEGETGGSNSYGVFIYGDNPLSILKSNRETGKKIAVIKESYGNAFVPYLTYNYDEVHVIDFRHWTGNLPKYCSENKIDEVLFINGIMSANTPMQIRAMDSLF